MFIGDFTGITLMPVSISGVLSMLIPCAFSMSFGTSKERTQTNTWPLILFPLMARPFERATKDEMTISTISDVLSELKAIPVKTGEGIITLRSESENARKILDRMNIPYSGRIVDSVPT